MELVSFTAFPNPEGFFCGQPSAKQLLHYCHYLTLVFLFLLSLEKLFFERAPVSGSPDSSFQSLEIALTSMNKTFVPFHRPATPHTCQTLVHTSCCRDYWSLLERLIN